MAARATTARSFRSQSAFRAWLAKHGASASELMVRCYKVEHKTRGLTYREALDEALCFGWIDGVRRGLDEVSFVTRFTPRKKDSAWSRVNIKRAGHRLTRRRTSWPYTSRMCRMCVYADESGHR